MQLVDCRLLSSSLHVGTRPEAIGYSAPAHGNAPFACALGIAVSVSGIPEQLVTFPADLGPKFVRHRLGDDLCAVEGEPGSSLTRDAGSKSLGCPDDCFGAYIPSFS